MLVLRRMAGAGVINVALTSQEMLVLLLGLVNSRYGKQQGACLDSGFSRLFFFFYQLSFRYLVFYHLHVIAPLNVT